MLIKEINTLVTCNSRYGYRWIAVLLRRAGCMIKRERVLCIWKAEEFGLPMRQTNRGFRGFNGLTFNNQHENGKKILYKLIKDVDIFTENFRYNAAERCGFTYEDLTKVNPNNVTSSISTYSAEGLLVKCSRFDSMVQVPGSLASLSGEKNNHMTTDQHSVADEAAALINF